MNYDMTKSKFLQFLGSLFVIPLVGKERMEDSDPSDIKSLELDYCKASNALWGYRMRRGFVPGVRVRAQYRQDTPMFGFIAPYGSRWSTVDSMCVPVLLDNGRCQPWSMSMLTIIATSTL